AVDYNRGAINRAYVSSWLNKEHRRAGGVGLMAALSNLIHSNNNDMAPPVPTIAEEDPKRNVILKEGLSSAQPTQTSDDLLEEAEPLTPNESVCVAAKEMDDNWPTLNSAASKTKGSTSLCSKRKENRKRGHAHGRHWRMIGERPMAISTLSFIRSSHNDLLTNVCSLFFARKCYRAVQVLYFCFIV
ncbi:hypothetical protein Tcan_08967, partial [Toxocara canis]